MNYLLGDGVYHAYEYVLLLSDPVAEKQVESVVDAIVGFDAFHFHVFFDEAYESGALDLHGLSVAVVERQHKVEKVALAQVVRRLLFEVSSTQAHNAVGILVVLWL